MDKGSHSKGTDTGIHALKQVLEAESRVAGNIEQTQAEAASILTQARRDALLVAERGDARIQALHACAQRSLHKKSKGITKAFQAERASNDLDLTQHELHKLIMLLARALTGQAD